LQWLLENGADPDIRLRLDKYGGSVHQPRTPMTLAAKLADPTALIMLIAYGAKLDPVAIFHATGGMRYPRNGTATLQVLIDAGADVNSVSKRWLTPLYHATRYQRIDTLKVLLERGADPDIRSGKHRTSARECAKAEGRKEYEELMQEAKPWIRRSKRIEKRVERGVVRS
jgi:ankyrin repeat protein